MKRLLLALALVLGLVAQAHGVVVMSVGPAINVTAATAATPIVVTTASAHGLAVNDWVVITGMTSMPEANGTWQCSAVAGGNTCTLTGSVGVNTYSGNGGIFKAQGLVAVSASNFFTCQTCNKAFVYIWSPGGAVATVNIEASPYPSTLTTTQKGPITAPNFVLTTVTNPGSPGTYFSVPVTSFIRINVTAWTSGTVYAALEGGRDDKVVQ